MKIYKIVISTGAQVDLDRIYDLIAFDLENPSSAIKIVRNILNKCRKLSIMPKATAVRIKMNGKKYRFSHIGRYTIIYYVNDKNLTVYIDAILYSRRDISTLLKSKA